MLRDSVPCKTITRLEHPAEIKILSGQNASAPTHLSLKFRPLAPAATQSWSTNHVLRTIQFVNKLNKHPLDDGVAVVAVNSQYVSIHTSINASGSLTVPFARQPDRIYSKL